MEIKAGVRTRKSGILYKFVVVIGSAFGGRGGASLRSGERTGRGVSLRLGEGEREERGRILSQVAGFESALRPSSQTSTEELEEFRSQDAEPQPLAENGRESFVEKANKPPTTSHNANTPSPPDYVPLR